MASRLRGGQAFKELRAAKTKAQDDWDLAAREWRVEVGPSRFDAKKDQLTKTLTQEYQGLPLLEKSRLDDLNRRQREIQLQRFMEGHLIARAKITGIGESRKTTLASYGIENAFDVTDRAVRNVPGFGGGLTSKIVAWRASIEKRFVFNPVLGIDPADIRKIKGEIARRRAEIEHALMRGPVELEQLRTHALNARQKPTQRLVETWRNLKQAEIDIA